MRSPPPGPAWPSRHRLTPVLENAPVRGVMKQSTLARRVRMALSQVIVDEWRLINPQISRGDPPSERSIAFQIGWHLRPLLERSWDIDCEYNRTGIAEAADIKRETTYGSPRLPDLIVHRRGLKGLENNLLVMELKTNHETQGSTGGSIGSVRNLMQHYNYRFGVLLDLRLSRGAPAPHWQWLAASSDNATPNAEPVYSDDGDLKALIERGQDEAARRYPPQVVT